MANVLHPHIDFQPRTVAHAPSPFGFGFGLGPSTSTSMMASTGWGASTPGHTNTAAFHQLVSSVTQSASMRPQKRRMSPDDELEHTRYSVASTSRDESMDRSPSPDRPKLAPPKRARVETIPDSKSNSTSKQNKGNDSHTEDDIDIGVLLARLPPQSLLPLLLTLLREKPALKNIILPLIPRPTLESAIHALAQSAKKLREALPYSSTPAYEPVSVFDSARTSHESIFTQSTQAPQPHMRVEYILSRLQPHINDYVATSTAYFPYFSCISISAQNSTFPPAAGQSNAKPQVRALHRDKFYPTETFLFLHAVTSHILEQPSLAQAELQKLLLPRLSEEWSTWVTRLDEQINGQSRIVGSETLKTWDRGLTGLIERQSSEISSMVKVVREKWVEKVGWLWLPTPAQQAMDEH